MRAGAIIACPPTIAIIAKDLIARRITLRFKLLVEKPPTSLLVACFFRSAIHMVNSQELTDSLTTTSTDIAPISNKGFISISLASVGTFLKTFLPMFIIASISIFLCSVRMCKAILASFLFSLFRVCSVFLSGFQILVTIFIIPFAAIFTSARKPIYHCPIPREHRDWLYLPAFMAQFSVFGHRFTSVANYNTKRRKVK